MISVIVPVFNERENIENLLQEIVEVSRNLPIEEIIYVDDCSDDDSFALLQSLKKDCPALRAIKHTRRSGQSAALWTGARAAACDLLVTMDGDGQNNPADIALLYEAYQKGAEKDGKLAVLGERTKRNDNWVRRLSSRLANAIRAGLLKDGTKDTGCSLKLIRRRDYLELPYFDHMHRFLPALLRREGARLVHVGVSHRARTHGQSKYGTLDRLIVGISDIRGVLWLQKRGGRVAADDTYEELN